MKTTLREMRLAIHMTHDCDAKNCIETVKVDSDQNGRARPIDVFLFEIEGHPTATQCYAWSVTVDRNTISIPAVLRSDEASNARQAFLSYRSERR